MDGDESPTFENLADELATAPVREAIERGLFAGAVTGVARSGETAYFRTCGFADREADRPMTPDTLFWIASLTKSITSTLVMMLVDEGKLALDAPAARYLPEFRGQTVAGRFGWSAKPRRAATVADLMRHLSGLPATLPTKSPAFDRMTLQEKSRIFGNLRLGSQPGERPLYANANYEALGRLIEVVADVPYEEFLQRRLLDPLEMQDTTFRPDSAQLKRLARPYAPADASGRLERRPFILVTEPFDDAGRTPTPSFGLFSTAADCLRFARIHLRGGELSGRRLLSSNSASLLLQRFAKPTGAETQGLAWILGEGSASMRGTMGSWLTLHLRHDAASIFLSAIADFGPEAQDACFAFVRGVNDELRERKRDERRQARRNRPTVRARRRRPFDVAVDE